MMKRREIIADCICGFVCGVLFVAFAMLVIHLIRIDIVGILKEMFV